jgi:hypothetical protein
MKKILTTSLVLFSLLLGSQQLISQPPPPPPGGHGDTGNQNAGNAPIGGGLFILLGLGAAYGAKKLYSLHQEQNALEE